MNITRDNYESWFLDYLEGHLEEGMVNEFIKFIHQNSDLKEELLLQCAQRFLTNTYAQFALKAEPQERRQMCLPEAIIQNDHHSIPTHFLFQECAVSRPYL